MLFMGKSTISMVIFNSYVKLPEGMDGTGDMIMIFLADVDRRVSHHLCYVMFESHL